MIVIVQLNLVEMRKRRPETEEVMHVLSAEFSLVIGRDFSVA